MSGEWQMANGEWESRTPPKRRGARLPFAIRHSPFARMANARGLA